MFKNSTNRDARLNERAGIIRQPADQTWGIHRQIDSAGVACLQNKSLH